LAKNKKDIKPKREMSRQQLSNWQKQARRQRLVLYIAIGVVAAVLLIIGAGWFFTDFQPRQQKVLVVNGKVFKMGDYLSVLKFYSTLQQADPSQISPSVISAIEEDEFVREGAKALGISVADNETEAALKNNNLSREFHDLVEAALLKQKVFDYFQSQVPANAEYRNIRAIFVESESKAEITRTALLAGDNFTEVASLASVDSYTKQQKGELGFQMKEILALPSYLGTSAVGDFAFSAPADNTTFSIVKDDAKVKTLGYWVIKVTDREMQTSDNQTPENQTSDNQTADNTTVDNITGDNVTTSDNQTIAVSRVKISGILLGSFDEADRVKARLDSGEDFAALAREVSQDKTSRDQGGDLGWFSKDTIRPALETFALNPATPLEKISDVLIDNAAVTTGGYWLVQVLEIDPNREVSATDRDTLAQTAYNDWYEAIRTNPENKIDILLTEKQRAWAVDTARKELG